MKSAIRVMVAISVFFGGTHSAANEANNVENAQWMIAISNNEAIHYAKFCGFYELRDLVAASVQNLSKSSEQRSAPVLEIRSIGYGGVSNVLIGEGWIAIGDLSAPISKDTFNRVVDLIGNRKGQKISKQKLDMKTDSILRTITDPIYKEENGCPSYNNY